MGSRRGQGYVYKRGNVWWISYSIAGKKYQESSRSRSHADAVTLLTQRLAERGRGLSRRDLEKVTFDDLADLILADYRKNSRKSIRRLETSLLHLRAGFSAWRVVDIREDAIDRYAADRLAEGAAAASVNRELAAFRRAFNLAERAKMARDVPKFEMLKEDNVRKGFFEDGELAAVEAALKPHLRPLLRAAYITGWRRGELLSREWRHVDFEDGWLRLDPGETKSGEGRMFPMIPQLRAILESQLTRKQAIERETGQIVTALFFHEDGRPVKDFRRAWVKACTEAGSPGRLFHDLRRSAARNLIRAGIAQRVAMELTGHLTASIFQRYAIVDETMLVEAAAKLSSHLGGNVKPNRKVLPLR